METHEYMLGLIPINCDKIDRPGALRTYCQVLAEYDTETNYVSRRSLVSMSRMVMISR